MIALPKPRKPLPSEKSGPMDTRGLALSKQHPERSALYLRFIRRHKCAIKSHGTTPLAKAHRCQGDVQAAHTETGGMGIKASDLTCAPLCLHSHYVYDNHLGHELFTREYGFDPRDVAAEYAEAWRRRTA